MSPPANSVVDPEAGKVVTAAEKGTQAGAARAGGSATTSASSTGPAPIADMGIPATDCGNDAPIPSAAKRPVGGVMTALAAKSTATSITVKPAGGGSSTSSAARPSAGGSSTPSAAKTGAGGASTPSAAKAGTFQPRVRKQRPTVISSSEESDSLSNNGPPAKKQKVAAGKPGQSTAGQRKAQPSGRPTKALLPSNTPAPRLRGRPPKNGTETAPPMAARTTPAAGRAKPEGSPGAEGARRAGKKNATKPILPWTAPPDETRGFTQDETTLLENGLYSDATIICLKDKFKVHRSVLCTRSKWFYNALNGDEEAGQTGVVNLHSTPKEDVEILLKYIYSGKLDLDKFGLGKCNFVTYAHLYNLGQTFEYKPLSDDTLTLLGQYCDKKLADLCIYDVEQSGRKGVVDEIRGNPDVFIDDLLKATRVAYNGVEQSNSLQSLFASFVWAGRDRLFQRKEFIAFSDQCPRFGNDMFKLMLGQNSCKWFPSNNIARTMCASLDHSRKTQHPDRCEGCDEVFDEAKVRKALYNPFNVAVRAGAWCAPCVKKHQGPAPLWRTPGNKDEEE